MADRPLPQWFQKARQIAARTASPVGKSFAARKEAKVAKLYLYDEIGLDPWTGGGITATDVIAALDEAKGSDLEVHINSPGGQVFEGVAIYNAIRGFQGTKTVYVDGLAASIASIIALAGDRVVTNEGASWMIHDPASGILTFGTADEIEDDARKLVAGLRSVRENLLDLYASATGQKRDQLSAWMAAETWMTAAEAKDRGFTHEVAKREAPVEARAAAPLVPVAGPKQQAAQARQRVAALNQLSGASPGAAPGQPGAVKTNTTPARRQENRK